LDNKRQTKLAWQKATSLFYHIHQVAAHVTFVLAGAFGTLIWEEGEVVQGQRRHHSKERWLFPIGLSIVTIIIIIIINIYTVQVHK